MQGENHSDSPAITRIFDAADRSILQMQAAERFVQRFLKAMNEVFYRCSA
jgi:hypothetical protein